MKKLIALMIIAMLAAAFLTGCGGGGNADVFSVNDVYDDPLAFAGEIVLNGVVAELLQSNRFEIADPNARPCCPAQFIPVQYDGTMPALNSNVNITGSFFAARGGPVFHATEVRRAG